MPKKTVPDDAVVIKGTLDGVTVVLNEDYDIVKLFSKLEQKIKANKSFFAGNQIKVGLVNRPFEKDEFDYIHSSLKLKYGVDVTSVQSVQEGAPSKTEEKSAFLFQRAQTTSNPRVVNHTLRAGQTVEHDGDIVVLGDINPGAEVVATGNVFIFGSLRGRCFAGSKGGRDAYIIALDFEPVQLRIADRVAISPGVQGLKRELRPQKAAIEGDAIVVVTIR